MAKNYSVEIRDSEEDNIGPFYGEHDSKKTARDHARELAGYRRSEFVQLAENEDFPEQIHAIAILCEGVNLEEFYPKFKEVREQFSDALRKGKNKPSLAEKLAWLENPENEEWVFQEKPTIEFSRWLLKHQALLTEDLRNRALQKISEGV